MSVVKRTPNEIRKDANDILMKVKSHFYSSERLDSLHNIDPSKYDSCMKEIKKVSLQIRETCKNFTFNIANVSGLITLTVSGLVVAACTIQILQTDDNKSYCHIKVFCTIGNDITQGYLIEEAERITLSHGIRLLSIDVPYKLVISHVQHGFHPVHLENIPTVTIGYNSTIMNIVEEVQELYEKKYKGTPDVKGVNRKTSTIRTLLEGVFGVKKIDHIVYHHQDKIDEWNKNVLPDNLFRLIKRNTLTMSKEISSTTITHDVKYNNPSSVVSDLGEATSRFFDMIRVEIHDLEDNVDPLKDMENLAQIVCRGSIGSDYIEQLKSGTRGENLIITVEISGVVLGFCIITFHDLGTQYEPYMYIHLVCAREYAGIGGYIFRRAEKYALSNNVKIVRLSGLSTVVDWYKGMHYKTGEDSHGNNPSELENKTPMMSLVFPEFLDNMKRMKKGIRVRTMVASSENGSHMTEETKIVKKKFIKYLEGAYESNPEILKKFLKDYDLLMTKYANKINKQNKGADEIYQADSFGIHMSRDLSVIH